MGASAAARRLMERFPDLALPIHDSSSHSGKLTVQKKKTCVSLQHASRRARPATIPPRARPSRTARSAPSAVTGTQAMARPAGLPPSRLTHRKGMSRATKAAPYTASRLVTKRPASSAVARAVSHSDRKPTRFQARARPPAAASRA